MKVSGEHVGIALLLVALVVLLVVCCKNKANFTVTRREDKARQYICDYCSAQGYCETHYDPLVKSWPYGVRDGMTYFSSSDPCMCCRNSYARRHSQ